MPDITYLTERLDPQKHDRDSFRCESPSLESYLKKQANQDRKRRIAVTYVLTGDKQLKGYYTLASTKVNLTDIPDQVAKKLPHYPALPAILLGRLAVHRDSQGQGYGKTLLVDALKRSCEISSLIGAFAVIVEAKDDQARAFYKHFGFIELSHDQYHLFLPMKTIQSLF